MVRLLVWVKGPRRTPVELGAAGLLGRLVKDGDVCIGTADGLTTM